MGLSELGDILELGFENGENGDETRVKFWANLFPEKRGNGIPSIHSSMMSIWRFPRIGVPLNHQF